MDHAPSRLTSLDGLRGVAALVVVVHHSLLTLPGLSVAYLGDGPQAERFTTAWWLTWTPLHLVWAGGEAVIVFFVLSGFVLVRPYLDRAAVPWNGYYARRLIRLYVPVAAGVALGAILLLAVSRTHGVGGSGWLVRYHPQHLSVHGVTMDLALVIEPPGFVSTVLWSLQWEVLFSLLLPLFVFGCYLARWRTPFFIGVCLIVIGLSPRTEPSTYYLPIFWIGALLATAFAGDRWLSRLTARSTRLTWATLTLVALGLLVSRWTVQRALLSRGLSARTTEGLTRVAVTVGAAILLVVALACPAARGLFDRRALQWLGSRSYSLYLVHEPIIVASAFAFGRTPAITWFLPLMIAVSLGAAELFHRAIERPSLRLAQYASRRATAASADRRP